MSIYYIWVLNSKGIWKKIDKKWDEKNIAKKSAKFFIQQSKLFIDFQVCKSDLSYFTYLPDEIYQNIWKRVYTNIVPDLDLFKNIRAVHLMIQEKKYGFVMSDIYTEMWNIINKIISNPHEIRVINYDPKYKYFKRVFDVHQKEKIFKKISWEESFSNSLIFMKWGC